MSEHITAARAAGELLLDLTAILGKSGFDIVLRIDLEHSSAVYEVFVSVTRLGTWHSSWAVSFQALETQTKGVGVHLPIRMASELRRSFDEWCAVKQAKEQA